MRFAVAASILVAQISLPTFSEANNRKLINILHVDVDDDDNHLKKEKKKDRKVDEEVFWKPDDEEEVVVNDNDVFIKEHIIGGRHRHHGGGGGNKKKVPNQESIIRKNGFSFVRKNRDGVLKNKKLSPKKIGYKDRTRQHRMECDPTTPTSTENTQVSDHNLAVNKEQADVGILGLCDVHEYCMESKYSKLGGFCSVKDGSGSISTTTSSDKMNWHDEEDMDAGMEDKTHRRILQETCDAPVMVGNGESQTCTTETDCFTLCKEQWCDYLVTTDYQSNDNTITSNTYCVYRSGPYSASYCTTRTSKNGKIETCAVTYNGENCASCSFDPIDTLYGDCFNFDCSNIIGPYRQGSKGNNCDFGTHIFPFVWDFFLSCYVFPCDICNGGTITNPDGISPIASTITCEFAASLASSGLPKHETECRFFQSLYYDACGCEDGNGPPFQCTACPDGGMVLYPDNEVNITTYFGDVLTERCSDVQFYAPYQTSLYDINEDTCPAFQDVIAEKCGCSTTRTPTATPVVVSSTNAPVTSDASHEQGFLLSLLSNFVRGGQGRISAADVVVIIAPIAITSTLLLLLASLG